MKLIGLHGVPRSGKDSIALMLCSVRGFQRIAMGDPLKRAAAVLLNRPFGECQGEGGYDREQIMPEWGFSMRWFLQKLGTEGIRDVIDKDFWIKRASSEIDSHITRASARDEKVSIAITDVRFPNEADFVRSRGGVVVHVLRPGAVGSAHASDQPIECDFTVWNDGTLDDLYRKVIFQDVLKLKEEI